MSCCNEDDPLRPDSAAHPAAGPDYLLRVSLGIIGLALILYIVPVPGLPLWLGQFSLATVGLLKTMWWGVVLGTLAIGLMEKVPREYFTAMLGRGDSVGGIFRAALAGFFFDLCSHGILMVGVKLYERGASLAQVMTFLISSPWNSFSLTLVLIALVGLPWTLAFVIGSLLIAVATGYLYTILTRRGMFPANPHAADIPADFNFVQDARTRLKNLRPDRRFFTEIVTDGLKGGQMVLRWLLFGTILAALIHVFVPAEIMAGYFGPSLMGLVLTLLATTVIEVCSEGSTPIAAEIFSRSAAPGNAFAFLMAGVSTDYTEIMVIRQFTGSWKTALSLPLLTVPQILLLGWIMNVAG